ncbi:hypothetical protein QTP70_031219, partial [Hemibagrus guttatus]
MGGCAFV